MLDFSDAPYQFFPPQPWKPVLALSRPLNRVLLRFDRRVHKTELSGEIESVKTLIKKGARILFTPNHPTRTDPQLFGEIVGRLGTSSSFMAAYDIFLESKLQAWFMQKNGCFSIDREGNDRKSLSTAIDILKKGDMALTIFPEGNVFHLNDRVTPILDGPAFIAAKTQKALKDEAEVYIVPISIKYSFLTDIRENLWASLRQVARDSNFPGRIDPDDPVKSVMAVGSHLISVYLKKTNKIHLDSKEPEQVSSELYKLTAELTGELESELEIPVEPETAILDRIRRVRAKIHQLRIDESEQNESNREKYSQLAERAIFAFRLLVYTMPYLLEKPNLDRLAETVARMREDHFSREFRAAGPRKAMVRIGEPISLKQSLSENGGKIKPVIAQLTGKIEDAIQHGIDKLNETNQEIGSQTLVGA